MSFQDQLRTADSSGILAHSSFAPENLISVMMLHELESVNNCGEGRLRDELC